MPTNKPDKTPVEVNHTDRGHAEFSPSGIKPLAVCAGYHGKDGNSKPAVLGTFIHEALETLDPTYQGKKIKVISLRWVKTKLRALIKKDPKIDFDFDEADIQTMNFLFHKIKKMEKKNLTKIFGEVVNKKWEGVNVFEVQLDMALGQNENFGTCDRLTIAPSGRFGLLADYKTGVSVIDFPRDNHQGINYAIGVFQKYPKLERLYFSFYVPQNGNKPQTDVFLRAELPELQRQIDTVITQAKEVRPLWQEGKAHPPIELLKAGDQCRFCRHVTRCEVPVKDVVDIFDIVTDGELTKAERDFLTNIEPTALLDPESHPEDVERLWMLAKRVIAWGEDYKSKVTALGNAGLEYPTLVLQSRAGRASIKDVEKIRDLAINTFGANESMVYEISAPPFAKLAALTEDDKGFREEAIRKGYAKKGATSYFMQAPRIPKKKAKKAAAKKAAKK